MVSIGIDIGSQSVKVVRLCGNETVIRVACHGGRPLAVLDGMLEGVGPADAYGVCGPMGDVPEVAALQRALQEVDPYDAVLSLGGESFAVYLLAGRRVASVLSQNKCAAGSGEFLVQQVGRLGLGLDEAIARSFSGKAVPLASRCTVHCKSDITHKLNRNEATVDDILHTLHASMADKVAAQIDRGGRVPRRLLAVGGMARNNAMLAALRRRLPGLVVDVRPESVAFEAWGCALLTRERPRHALPKVALRKTFGALPPLGPYGARVKAIDPPELAAPGEGPLVLGVDAGSTTTKAVAIDAATERMVAFHYGGTLGNPVEATRTCLRALAERVGERPFRLTGVTGSARGIVGAFLGTPHVYNEISAHAAGAASYDPGVDTIFEIGGQDAKFIRLRNGVPVDYAMNGACSAGTGSFLEECAQGDLNTAVTELAASALRADAPLQFKSTCAAFINTEIRTALLEGHSTDRVAAGLVYAIVANYLAKVKGPRPVGTRVFLQGGVARNRAVAHAFARCLEREVVIPPHPELLGAFGVAMLARERAAGQAEGDATLPGLARGEMKAAGRFTCGACGLACPIERFEVAGRRFPYGGRCSLFERPGRRDGPVAGRDVVEERAGIVLAPPPVTAGKGAARVGIPRALTTHALFPLYATFFARLGMEVVLSGVDARGEGRAQASFCYPVQRAHGAVADLVARGVDWIFVPHVIRMPGHPEGKDAVLCPLTQAAPYVLAKAFPRALLLAPELDFGGGYGASTAMAESAVRTFAVSRKDAAAAYEAAVAAQVEAERSLRALGRKALSDALSRKESAVVLVGRSYNAFAPEASQFVGRKLASMGMAVIPGDCVGEGRGPTAWTSANVILDAARLAQAHANLFLVYVSNFSCTIDAFVLSRLSGWLGSKPYLVLEIDAHTADAGLQTRLEAFAEVVKHFSAEGSRAGRPFSACRTTPDGVVTASDGTRVALADARVKLYLPGFSDYHSEAGAAALRWAGLHPGAPIRLSRSQLDRGLRCTSGRECLPLPICIGQMLEVHEGRGPGEIVGYYALQGGAPCVVDAYTDYFRRFIRERRLQDTFVFDVWKAPDGPEGKGNVSQTLPTLVSLADVLVEMEQALRVVGDRESVSRLRAAWSGVASTASSLKDLMARLPRFSEEIAALPRTRTPEDCPRVVVIGDFFTRFSTFFIEGIPEIYASHGIILKPVGLNDLVLYWLYDRIAATARGWGTEPGSCGSAARACARVLQPAGRAYLTDWARYEGLRRIEARVRRELRRTGLLAPGADPAARGYSEAGKHLSPRIFGEAIPTIGKGLKSDVEGYDGIFLIGPFNCLPFRISEAVLRPLCAERGTPFLAYETDGYGVSHAFPRQVDVHIQQILDHHEKRLRRGRGDVRARLDRVRSAARAL